MLPVAGEHLVPAADLQEPVVAVEVEPLVDIPPALAAQLEPVEVGLSWPDVTLDGEGAVVVCRRHLLRIAAGATARVAERVYRLDLNDRSGRPCRKVFDVDQ